MENEVKEPVPKYHFISPEEYLKLERNADEKHEYYNGYLVAISGADLIHNQIALNLYEKLANHLDGKDFRALPSNMRVSTANGDAYMYPVASIVCGQPQFEDDIPGTLTNPSVVFEIWSPSVKNDLGYKLLHYKNIPSLREYIMIDASKRFVQVVRKESNDAWRFEDITEEIERMYIGTIHLSISFDDLYLNTGL